MSVPQFLDPEKIIPISRSTTRVFKTGAWDSRRPVHLEKVSPCRAACPAGNHIPKALLSAAQCDLDGALRAFLEESPLPGVCGRVCYHPCESECNRGEWDGAVQIRALERAASEMGTAVPGILTEAGRDHSVAVVGSGPAGLSAAYHLARMGHPVTLIEADSELGGLLRWGIPEYRLPRHVLEKDISRVLSLGIQVAAGVRMDGALLKGLRDAHHAVFLATGAQGSRSLIIPGMDLRDVTLGVEFLRDVRREAVTDLPGKVLVIGGGNVAIDAALSARRLGAEQVDLVCLEQRDEMPAHEREREDALEEGIIFHNGWGPLAITGREGRVARGLFAKCISLFDEQGRFSPSYDERTTMSLEADRVILAIGQTPDLSFLNGSPLFDPASDAGLPVDAQSMETSLRGVFAGGDLVKSPGSVVEAVAAGKRAALAIHCRLQGMPLGETVEKVLMGGGPSFSIEAVFHPREGWEPGSLVRFENLEPLFLDHRERGDIRRLEVAERTRGFQEINLALYPDEAIDEAGRCFFCGACTGCDRCYLFCPEVSIVPPGEGHPGYQADTDYCKGCAVCAAVCPRGVMTMGEKK